MPSALVLIANGSEEMEFAITFDTLVRAGVTCTSAFVSETADAHPAPSSVAKCSRGVKIIADVDLRDLEDLHKYDALIVPGGAKGAETLSKDVTVRKLIREYHSNGKIVGMICAGSLAALTASLSNTRLTSHPSVKSQLEGKFEYLDESVVVSGNLVTSRGPGTAFLFALTLVEALCGKAKREEVYEPMIFPTGYYTGLNAPRDSLEPGRPLPTPSTRVPLESAFRADMFVYSERSYGCGLSRASRVIPPPRLWLCTPFLTRQWGAALLRG